MIEAYRDFFNGDLAPIGAHLTLTEPHGPQRPCNTLLDLDHLGDILSRYASNYQAPDCRAVASQWSKLYFSRLMMPVLAINIALDRNLPIDLGDTSVILSCDGKAETFCLINAGATLQPASFADRFESLVDGHLAPLIPAISKSSGLSRKVLWANCGNIFENVVSFCAELLGETEGVRQGRELLASRTWRDCTPNMLFNPVQYRVSGDRPVRKRRICCIRYLIPELKLCSTCPLEHRPDMPS